MRVQTFSVILRLSFLEGTFLLLEGLGKIRKRIESWRVAILAFPIPLLLVTWLAAQGTRSELLKPILTSGSALLAKPAWLENTLGALLGWEILGCVILFLPFFLYELHRARKRIVIREFRRFHGHREVSAPKEGASGIAGLLGNELLRMDELYRHVDEVSASQTGTIVRASPSVFSPGRVSEDLGDAVGLDFAIPLGKLQIPAGSLLGAIAWLVRGPRLTGSLHEDPTPLEAHMRYVVVARLSGGGLTGTWRADGSDLTDEERWRSEAALVHRLIEILACRITTDLMDLGSPRWKAIQSYTEGLRDLRRAQRHSIERIAALRSAETHFRRALDEDENFAQAYFNLGLVYRELAQHPAARLAFRHAIEADPNHDKACYALAESYYQSQTFADAIWLAHNAAAIRARHPGAWNLGSQAIWSRDSGGKCETAPPTKEVLRGFEVAALAAWEELCRAQLEDHNISEARDIARICTGRLGVAYSRSGLAGNGALLHWASRIAFRTALRLAPGDNNLNYDLGKARWGARDYKGAYGAFDRVFEDGLDLAEQIELWAYLLSTHLRLSTRVGEPKKTKHSADAKDCYLLARDTLAIPDWAFPKRAEQTPPPKDREQPPSPYLERLTQYQNILDHLRETAEDTSERKYFDWLHRDREFLLALEEHLKGLRHEQLPRVLKIGDPFAFEYDRELGDERDWCYEQMVTRVADHYFSKGDSEELGGEGNKDLPILIETLSKARDLSKNRRFSSPFESRLREHLASAYLLRHREQDGTENDLDEALACAEKAVQRNPQSREGQFLLGRIHLEMDDVIQASQDLEACLHLPPDFPQAIEALGRALWKRAVECGDPEHRRGLLQKAAVRFEEILKLAENDPLIGHETHGIAHGWVGRFNCALEKYDEGLYHLGIALKMGKQSVEHLLAAGEGRVGRAETKTDTLRTEDIREAKSLLQRAGKTDLEGSYKVRYEALELRLRRLERPALAA